MLLIVHRKLNRFNEQSNLFGRFFCFVLVMLDVSTGDMSKQQTTMSLVQIVTVQCYRYNECGRSEFLHLIGTNCFRLKRYASCDPTLMLMVSFLPLEEWVQFLIMIMKHKLISINWCRWVIVASSSSSATQIMSHLKQANLCIGGIYFNGGRF